LIAGYPILGARTSLGATKIFERRGLVEASLPPKSAAMRRNSS
jgi:hypothetical protein